jgi:hypothetical protein
MSYGAELTGQLVDLWAYHHSVRLDFSRPGKPTEVGFYRRVRRFDASGARVGTTA